MNAERQETHRGWKAGHFRQVCRNGRRGRDSPRGRTHDGRAGFGRQNRFPYQRIPGTVIGYPHKIPCVAGKNEENEASAIGGIQCRKCRKSASAVENIDLDEFGMIFHEPAGKGGAFGRNGNFGRHRHSLKCGRVRQKRHHSRFRHPPRKESGRRSRFDAGAGRGHRVQ